MLDRLRRALHRENPAALEERLELARHEPVVGSVVGHAEGDRLALHAAEGQVHLPGLASLQLPHHVGVEAELQDGRRRRVTGELGIPDLIAPPAEVAGLLHPPQEVRVAEATPVEEHRLVDDVGAGAYRRQSLVAPADAALLVGQILVPLDLDDREPVAVKGLQEALLVLHAPPGDAVQDRVGANGSRELAPRGRALEVSEVRTFEVRDEVRRGVHETRVDSLHRPMLYGHGAGNARSGGDVGTRGRGGSTRTIQPRGIIRLTCRRWLAPRWIGRLRGCEDRPRHAFGGELLLRRRLPVVRWSLRLLLPRHGAPLLLSPLR